MKSLYELYSLLLIVYEDTMSSIYICCSIENLLLRKQITKEEYSIILKHFQSQYPTKEIHKEFFDNPLFKEIHKEFFDNPLFKDWGIELSWFENNKYIRIKLLNKIIKLLENGKNI